MICVEVLTIFYPDDFSKVYKRHNPTWDETSDEFDYKCLKRIKMYTPQLFKREENKCYRISLDKEYIIGTKKYNCEGVVKTNKTIKLIKL